MTIVQYNKNNNNNKNNINVLPPVGSALTKQQEWGKPSIAADVARLKSSLHGIHSSSSAAGSVGSPQRWLTSCTAYFLLWSASGWWNCQSCGVTTSWSQTLWAPSMSMRRQGRSWRHSWPRMQTQRRQNNTTSRINRGVYPPRPMTQAFPPCFSLLFLPGTLPRPSFSSS